MDFIELDYPENSDQTVLWINEDTRLKAPNALVLPDSKISLGIKEKNTLVARLVGSVFFNGFHIELLATSPDTRSAGYGGALLEHAISIAKDKGVHFVTLETMSFNAPNFYLKHGFEVLKKVDDSPIDGTSHFFMYKDLRN